MSYTSVKIYANECLFKNLKCISPVCVCIHKLFKTVFESNARDTRAFRGVKYALTSRFATHLYSGCGARGTGKKIEGIIVHLVNY